MADTMEIIISAVDSASEVFQTIINSAQEMADGINDSIGGAGDDFETISSALEDANAEVERLTEELAGIYMGDIEGDADAVEEALARAEDEAQKLSDALAEASNSGDGLEESVNGIESLMAFQEISGYVNQLADAMWQVTDRAGNVQDSFTRLGLAAEGAGVDVDTMKSTVSNLADETGRAGSSIRESFIAMTSAGITDMETMQTVFKGASAQAFILGTDVETLANKFSGMAMKSTLSERTLKGTGITMQELGEAMGLQGATIDEVKEKWSELDVNQRAAALGMAASMNEGKDANEEYKNSWQGLQDQIEIAKGKLEVLAGKVFLPVLIPIMQTAGRVLDWLGDTIGAVMDGPFGTFISIVGSAAGGIVLLVAAVTAITAGMGFFTASLFPAITASWALIAPWLPFIAIGAAIIAVIYKIGEAFGWWTDASSMIDAIGAGLQRLWNAFINHPDVQAVISALSAAWDWLMSSIQGVGQAVMDFFGINSEGNFDVVRAIIDGIGFAWQAITFPIRTVITLIQYLWGAFSSFYSGALVPFGSYISDVLAPVFNWLSELWAALIGQVQPVIDVFNQFQAGQVGLVEVITTVGSTLWNLWVTLASSLSNLILQLVSNLLTWAIQGGLNVLNGIGLYLSQVPGKVWNWLGNTAAARILVALVKWVTYARQKAQQFLTSVITYFSQLPGRVYTQLIAVASRIISVGQQWVSNARSKAQEIVNGVVNILSNTANAVASALSGVVDAIVKPFRDAYNKAKEYWDMITNLGNAQGGDSAWGGDDFTDGDEFILSSPKKVIIDDSRIEIDHNHNLKLDLENVPAHIDTDTLIKMLTSKEVLEGFVASSEYQTVDKMAKDRLKGRFNRAIGG